MRILLLCALLLSGCTDDQMRYPRQGERYPGYETHAGPFTAARLGAKTPDSGQTAKQDLAGTIQAEPGLAVKPSSPPATLEASVIPADAPTNVSTVGALFVIIVLAVAGGLDVYLAGWYGEYATISAQVRTWCSRWPVLYIALAWLLFHLTALPAPPR
jgi:hypothetical protein